MGIVERIQQKLKENGSNIKNLEREIGIGNGTIRRWNERSPQCDKLSAVANYLNVSLDWLVFGIESGELSKDEQDLIDAYRRAGDNERRAILTNAKILAPESGGSSTSRTG